MVSYVPFFSLPPLPLCSIDPESARRKRSSEGKWADEGRWPCQSAASNNLLSWPHWWTRCTLTCSMNGQPGLSLTSCFWEADLSCVNLDTHNTGMEKYRSVCSYLLCHGFCLGQDGDGEGAIILIAAPADADPVSFILHSWQERHMEKWCVRQGLAGKHLTLYGLSRPALNHCFFKASISNTCRSPGCNVSTGKPGKLAVQGSVWTGEMSRFLKDWSI